MAQSLKFRKVASMPSTLEVGTIYFDKSEKSIKVATATGASDQFSGVLSASYNSSTEILTIVNENKETIQVKLGELQKKSDVITYTNGAGISKSTSGNTVTFAVNTNDIATVDSVNKKLNIGESSDKSTEVSYYGLKNYVDSVSGAAGNLQNSYDTLSATVASNTSAISSLSSEVETVDTRIAAAVTSVYRVKGSVDTADALKAVVNPTPGDVYNVKNASTSTDGTIVALAGSNFVYTSDGWDRLGGTVDLSNYMTTDDIESLVSTSISETTVDVSGTEGFIATIAKNGTNISATRKKIVTTDISDRTSALVTSLAGSHGDITFDNSSTSEKKVTLSMSGTKMSASIGDISTLVWTEFN